jgi:hypothetical protein
MKKVIFKVGLIILSMLLFISCSRNNNGISKNEEKEIKETIDLVLSYDKGYDETVNKYISEENFYICNYVEFYSLYIGKLQLEEYESEIVSIANDNDLIEVCLVLNMRAKSSDVHDDEENSDEAIGKDVPVEVLLTIEDENYYIRSFTEYENLEKAKELNKGFK